MLSCHAQKRHLRDLSISFTFMDYTLFEVWRICRFSAQEDQQNAWSTGRWERTVYRHFFFISHALFQVKWKLPWKRTAKIRHLPCRLHKLKWNLISLPIFCHKYSINVMGSSDTTPAAKVKTRFHSRISPYGRINRVREKGHLHVVVNRIINSSQCHNHIKSP